MRKALPDIPPDEDIDVNSDPCFVHKKRNGNEPEVFFCQYP